MRIQTAPCMHCGKTSEMEVDSTAYFRWHEQGWLIQQAFPEFDDGERELLKSGIHPDCWDKMFGDIEDEDEPAPEVRYCSAVVIRETRVDPAEYCEEEAEPDSEFCARHGEQDDEYEPDDRDYDWPDEHDHNL